MQKRFVSERCPSPTVDHFPAFFEISFQWIFEHGYHDGIDQSHATIIHDQTWIRFGWEKLSFSAPDSIQEVWNGRNAMTPCDQRCYSQWGVAFYRVSHNYFINVAVLLTEQDIARCVYGKIMSFLPHVVQYAGGLFNRKKLLLVDPDWLPEA